MSDTIRKLLEEVDCTCGSGSDGACDRCAALAELESLELSVLRKMKKQNHIDSLECWCEPEVNYIDPVTGNMVIVHRNRH